MKSTSPMVDATFHYSILGHVTHQPTERDVSSARLYTASHRHSGHNRQNIYGKIKVVHEESYFTFKKIKIIIYPKQPQGSN